jgi:nucleoside-diphosphate-sugar epimerase
MRVFMSGSNGFAGTTLATRLIDPGHEVTVRTRTLSKKPENGRFIFPRRRTHDGFLNLPWNLME